MNKEDFLKKLSNELDNLEDIENLTFEGCRISFSDYNPDNRRYETKYSYRYFDLISQNGKDFKIDDLSEGFKCTMGSSFCKERGYCNGDC